MAIHAVKDQPSVLAAVLGPPAHRGFIGSEIPLIRGFQGVEQILITLPLRAPLFLRTTQDASHAIRIERKAESVLPVSLLLMRPADALCLTQGSESQASAATGRAGVDGRLRSREFRWHIPAGAA